MPDTRIATPLRYRPSFEKPERDEAETTAKLAQAMRANSHAVRSMHAKNHGLLRARLRVLDKLPEALAQGLFAYADEYDVVMRYSTVPGDILAGSLSARGLAIKVLGVPGERLPGSEGTSTQDFVLVNGPAFGAPSLRKLLSGLRSPKKSLSKLPRGVEKVVEAAGGESYAQTHMLGESYYSQAPLLYGHYIVKVCVAPISPQPAALGGAKVDLPDDPDGLRETVLDFFGRGGEWEVRVQLCTDLEAMPIEDSSRRWPEELSPYLPVARICAPAQPAWTEKTSKAIDDGLSFSPWHGIATHRPLGSIMRARKTACEMARQFRQSQNRQPVAKPRSPEHITG